MCPLRNCLALGQQGREGPLNRACPSRQPDRGEPCIERSRILIAIGAKQDFVVRAIRSYVAGVIPRRLENALGDVDSEDITEVIAIGELEVKPKPPLHGWVLRVRIEDAPGPRLSADAASVESDEEIELEAFYEDFIAPDRGTAFVDVETDSPEAWRRFQTLLNHIRNDMP